jgi:hypothetical protein
MKELPPDREYERQGRIIMVRHYGTEMAGKVAVGIYRGRGWRITGNWPKYVKGVWKVVASRGKSERPKRRRR